MPSGYHSHCSPPWRSWSLIAYGRTGCHKALCLAHQNAGSLIAFFLRPWRQVFLSAITVVAVRNFTAFAGEHLLSMSLVLRRLDHWRWRFSSPLASWWFLVRFRCRQTKTWPPCLLTGRWHRYWALSFFFSGQRAGVQHGPKVRRWLLVGCSCQFSRAITLRW